MLAGGCTDLKAISRAQGNAYHAWPLDRAGKYWLSLSSRPQGTWQSGPGVSTGLVHEEALGEGKTSPPTACTPWDRTPEVPPKFPSSSPSNLSPGCCAISPAPSTVPGAQNDCPQGQGLQRTAGIQPTCRPGNN